jgi:hypothetical protein
LSMEEQAGGAAIIVYMDNSYVNLKHGSNYTYFIIPRHQSPISFREGLGKVGTYLLCINASSDLVLYTVGKRLIIVGAITRDGILCERKSATNNDIDNRYYLIGRLH